MSASSVVGRSRTKVILTFLGVFGLGALAGGAVGHVIETRREIDVFDAAGQGSRHGVFLWSLERKLDLSSDQESQITTILTRYDRETAQVAPDPKLTSLRTQMRAEVRATLDAQQQKRFDELIASWDAVRKRAGSNDVPAPAPSATEAKGAP